MLVFWWASSVFKFILVLDTVKPGLSVPLFAKHRLCVLFLPVFWNHDNNLHPITQVFQTRHVVFDRPYCLKVAKVLFCHIAERSFTSRLLYWLAINSKLTMVTGLKGVQFSLYLSMREINKIGRPWNRRRSRFLNRTISSYQLIMTITIVTKVKSFIWKRAFNGHF